MGFSDDMRTVAKVVIWVIVLAVVAVGAKVAYDHLRGGGKAPSLSSQLKQDLTSSVLGNKPINILFIGNNARNATSPLTPGQADLIIVAHVEPAQHTVVLITLPRNIMVAYPGWRDTIPKLKSAFFMGGPTLAVRTVSRLLGMPISLYVVSDFQGFVDAVNAVGGLTVDIPCRIYDPQHSHAVFSPGVQHLDGAQALAYIRVRQNLAGNGCRVNDFQRMQAAVGFLKLVEAQAIKNLSPGEVVNLMSAWNQDVATNLNLAQEAALVAVADHATITHVTVGSLSDSMELRTTSFPGLNQEGTITGAYYDILTPQEILSAVGSLGAKNPTTGLPPLPAPQSLTVFLTNNGGGSLSAALLRKAGITAHLSNLVPPSPGVTEVLYPPGDLLQAMVVGRALGYSDEIVAPANVPALEVESH